MSIYFQKGVKGWSAVQQQQKDYRKAREEDALRYAPITQQDLIDTGTRDYESAKRAFGGRAKDATQGLKVIEFMSYVGKDLTTIPLELRDGPRIRTLHMGHNMLPRIDVSFFKMPIIRELNLDQNELEEIPAEFRDIKAKMMRHIRYLSTLEVLSIKNNKIAHVNYHFCSLTNLQELSLSNNKLKVLPSFLGSLCQLTHLWLSHNQLEKLPHDEVVKLLEFDPNTGERYERLSLGMGGLSSLQELWLDNNVLTEITGEIGRCQELKYINLRGNMLASMPVETQQLSRLQCLMLSHNRLVEIPLQVVRLPQLHTLQIENNEITSIADSIVEAKMLTNLDVSFNPLKSVPSVISTMTQLIDFKAKNVVHDHRGVAFSATWSRHHAHSDSFSKLIHVESGSVTVPNRLIVYRSKNLPHTTCGRLYSDHYLSHGETRESTSARASTPGGTMRKESAGGGRKDVESLNIENSRPASRCSVGSRRASVGGFREKSTEEDASSGLPPRSASGDSAGVRSRTAGKDRKEKLKLVSGATIMPEEQLEEFLSHPELLMRARKDLLNTRAVTPLLRDAKLIDEDEAEIRLAEGEAEFLRAKELYERPSSSAQVFRPVDFWDRCIDTESRPMTLMTPGGKLPDQRAVAYRPPPTSMRPPTAPFSSSRLNTGTR